MRERLGRFVSVSMMALAVMLSPCARAQQETNRASGDQNSTAPASVTIRGAIAGVTTEGEIFFNHQTNAVVKAEAAFLTVVGSPIHSEARDKDRASAASGNEKHAGRRHNIYIVWLTPKTKVCEAARDAGTSDRAKDAAPESGTSEHAKKEVALDQLEVGDHVEIQFTRNEDSASHNNIHQSEQMRRKHGRHRTHVGFATTITIMPPSDHAQSSSGT
jgi:hypothetical protein